MKNNFIILLVAGLLCFNNASCSDNSPTDIIEQPPTEPEEPDEPDMPADWIPGSDENGEVLPLIADSSFYYYNKAFLLQGNGEDKHTYYRSDENSTHWAFYWNQALIILMVEDRYYFTEDPKLKPFISKLLYAFLEHEKNPVTNETKDWTWNDFTDDLLWAGLAFIRGYQITGDERFLEQAQWDWKFLYERAYDTELGGGLWWRAGGENTPEYKAEKSGLSNNPAVSMACYLYEATGDKYYLKRAKEIYNWIYNTLREPNGAIDEHIKKNGIKTKSYNVYNVGAFIEAAAVLYRITGDRNYAADAETSIGFVMKERVNDDGIMSKWHRDGTWQSEFARGMGIYVKDNNLWNKAAVYGKTNTPTTYYEWMKMNADAAWNTHNKRYLTFNEWAKATPLTPETDKAWTALEMVSSVVMTQVTPEIKPQ